MITTLSNHLQDLSRMLDPERVSATDAQRREHSRDQSSHPPVLPDLVVWPTSTEEVSAILRYANQHRIPVVGWGAGTSIEGNPIPLQAGIVIDFRRMNRILEIHAEDFQVTVEPGVLYKDMNETLARYGLFFPPDPGANASIGGMVANNAAGIRTVKYGATRDNVLALEVVLSSGDVVRTGSRAVKQSAGYDLTHLFTGSEGTLGLVTSATLKLSPIPAEFSAVCASFQDIESAAHAVYEIIGAGLGPNALELLDGNTVSILAKEGGFDLPPTPTLFIEFSGASRGALEEILEMAEAICQDLGCHRFEAGMGQTARSRLWEARHALFETLQRHFAGMNYLLTDSAVPISNYPELVAFAVGIGEEAGLDVGFIGHAGDGNLHTTIFFPPDDERLAREALRFNDLLTRKAIELEGTCTGEHGVGAGKSKYLEVEFGAEAVDLMRRLKQLLDPNQILNPGKVV